jgi:hypothetical protein
MASTPATNVVATAPMPTIIMPSLPRAGAILVAVVFSAAEEAINTGPSLSCVETLYLLVLS